MLDQNTFKAFNINLSDEFISLANMIVVSNENPDANKYNVLFNCEKNDLNETWHSRILASLLKDDALRASFISCFFETIDCPFETAEVICEQDRIDISIKADDFFIIIENKVNNAIDQQSQISRYVEIAKKNYPIKKIYVLYLKRDSPEKPSEQSLKDLDKDFPEDHLVSACFKHDIIGWLNSLTLNDLDPTKKNCLYRNLITYKEYLEVIFNCSEEEKKIEKILHLREDDPPEKKIKKAEEKIEEYKSYPKIHDILKNFRRLKVTEQLRLLKVELDKQLGMDLTVNEWELDVGFWSADGNFEFCIKEVEPGNYNCMLYRVGGAQNESHRKVCKIIEKELSTQARQGYNSKHFFFDGPYPNDYVRRFIEITEIIRKIPDVKISDKNLKTEQ